MKPLRLASFGIRGFVGDTLTPRVVVDFTSAFATFVDGGRVLLARDTRGSSPMLHSAVVSSLLSAGCEVLDLGVCPTPLLQFSVPRYKAAGGISISGGHNGMGWNALSLIGADGAYLEPMGGETVLDLYHATDFRKADWKGMGRLVELEDFQEPYFDALEKHVSVEAIRKANLIVLIDPVGGAACPYLKTFADRLGFALMPINAEPSSYLPREPEPRPRSALQMASVIRHVKGDVGFVLSSDMQRLSLVTEEGEPASEEYTFPVIANHILARHPGSLVTNSCTTRTVDDVAAAHDASVIKTKVGQAYIMSAVADTEAVMGGEGSGSVVFPSFSPAYDGFLMMAMVLEAMSVSRQRISQQIKSLPRYEITKKKFPCDSRHAYRAVEYLEDYWREQPGVKLDLTDGMRIDWKDGWAHIRGSRTEQMLRIISEAPTRDLAEQRAGALMRMAEQAL